MGMESAELISKIAENVIGVVKSMMEEERFGRGNLGSELTKLKHRLETLKSVFARMEEVEEDCQQKKKNWVCKAKEIIYDADDLMDELVTLSEMNMLDLEDAKTAFLKKVRIYFSQKYVLGRRASVQVRQISERIDAVMSHYVEGNNNNNNNNNINLRGVVSCEESKHVSSWAEVSTVIGRDSDRNSIIEMLCGGICADPDPISVIPIVGMGGLGKTTLAKYIYNSDKVNQEFQLKMWVTVSTDFDANSVLSQIWQSATGLAEGTARPSMDELRHLLGSKKCLLVLDDIWNESSQDWHVVTDILPTPTPKGSKCLVTTRSILAARSLGDGPVYELQGLSNTDSWQLFERFAFSQGTQSRDQRFVDVGKKIVSKCAGLPLAIRTLGSLLYGHGLDKWYSLKNADFANTSQVDSILSSLKLSYDCLSPPVKQCFIFCSLFPKAHRFNKKSLIQLWIAEGFVCPAHDRALEDTAEDYFTALLHRSFYHDVQTDSLGGILSCKMHDLLHDLAMSVAQNEFFMATPSSVTVSDQTRHLSIVGGKNDTLLSSFLPALGNIHTYLNFSLPTRIQHPITWTSLISTARRLRVLDLRNLNISTLPEAAGQLLHLRYLDLSGYSRLEMLPGSITKLYNLQTLKLSGCSSLKELPCDFGKLVQLRNLDINGCNKLSHMPPGFSNLTSLHELTMFVVGQQSYASVPYQLEVLKSLSNLRGSLTIKLQTGSAYDAMKTRDAEYLRSMNHLNELYVQWVSSETLHQVTPCDHDALLEGLKPQCSLRSLKVVGFPGVTIPSWAASSANLLSICLDDCPQLHHLPQLSQLPHLKSLVLHKLGSLEYMESNCYLSSDPRSRTAEPPTFFPSLEKLTLSHLPKVKGWPIVVGEGQEMEPYHHLGDGTFDRFSLPSFPCLHQLKIMECPQLVSVPPCRQLEELNLYGFNETLQLILSTNSKQQQHSGHSLRMKVTLDNVGYINRLPLEFHPYICYISIHLCDLETLSPSKELFTGSMCSLQSLQVTLCSRLKSLSGLGWKHLTSLQRLQLSSLPVLDLSDKSGNGEEDVIPWHLLHSLQYVELDFLPKLLDIPEGIRYLTALKTLEIRSCHNLKALPEWISCLGNLRSLCLEACTVLECLPDSMMHLTSLEKLEILRCSGSLREKCQQPMGEDWPKIRHIPHISIF